MTEEPIDPWRYMGPQEAKILGDIIFDPAEQTRWCRAILFGTLPYMWRDRAGVVRDMMFAKLEMRPADKVLLIGECIAECGFDETIRAAIGPEGEMTGIDIAPEARAAYVAGRRGRHGNLATWRWNYTYGFPDAYFDAVAILQSVQHAEDWSETGTELLRVLKPGRPIVLSEITLGPNMINAASLDIHIQSWIDKIFARMGWQVADFPYYSPETLLRAFAGKVESAETFSWRGIELFWGRKPTTSS